MKGIWTHSLLWDSHTSRLGYVSSGALSALRGMFSYTRSLNELSQNEGDQLSASPVCIFLLAGGKRHGRWFIGYHKQHHRKKLRYNVVGQMSKLLQAIVCFLGYQRLRCLVKPIVTDSFSRSNWGGKGKIMRKWLSYSFLHRQYYTIM